RRKSPTRRVFSILPVGMRNASTRKVLMTRKRTSATAIDLIHSQAQLAPECGVVWLVVDFWSFWRVLRLIIILATGTTRGGDADLASAASTARCVWTRYPLALRRPGRLHITFQA